MITQPIGKIKVSKIDAATAQPLASKDVLQGLSSGRVGVVVMAGDADVYIGDDKVTSDTGLQIKAGEKFEIAVNDYAKNNIYVIGGSVTIAEYFR